MRQTPTLCVPLLSAIALGLSGCMTHAPTEVMSETQIETVHKSALVLDAHADIALPATSALYLGRDGQSKVALSKLEAGGVDAVVMSLAAGPKPRTDEGRRRAAEEVEAKLAAIHALIEAAPARIGLATRAETVEALVAEDRIAIILGMQNLQSLEGDLEKLDTYFAAGARVFALTHMGHNDYADSSRPLFNGDTGTYEVTEEHGGLSALGRAAVARIDALGGIIDVSQTSKAATLEAITLVSTPVIASHSNVQALSDVTRNLSDEEIDAIGASGGVIHIAAFSAYLVDLSDPSMRENIRKVRVNAGLPETYAYPYELYWELTDEVEKLTFLTQMRALVGREDVARLVDHIDYVVNRVGIDHVGIGTDFNHGGGIVGFAEADAAGNVTAELLARGYTVEDITKIWGGNFLRVLARADETIK